MCLNVIKLIFVCYLSPKGNLLHLQFDNGFTCPSCSSLKFSCDWVPAVLSIYDIWHDYFNVHMCARRLTDASLICCTVFLLIILGFILTTTCSVSAAAVACVQWIMLLCCLRNLKTKLYLAISEHTIIY